MSELTREERRGLRQVAKLEESGIKLPDNERADFFQRVMRRIKAGMGGASSRPGSAIRDPHTTNVYGDPFDDDVELSTTGARTTSDGVGITLYNPDDAVRRIEEDPGVKREWWPKPVKYEPNRPVRSPVTALLSWFLGLSD